MINRAFLLIVLCLLTESCSTVTKVQPLGKAYHSKPGNCSIVFYRDKKPDMSYERIGKIESHIKRDIFLGGTVKLDNAYPELRKKACQMGGDAVIIDDFMRSGAGELSFLHVWATVIKFQTINDTK